jgi:multidrug efflux pump subunit AcrA (membrane-fusion protein)
LFALCVLCCGCTGKHEEEAAVKPVVEVKVARVERMDLELATRAPATIFPREQAGVSSKITAPIRELRARKGDHVSKGQVLARLENRDLVAQRTEAVTKAQADLAVATAALNQAQKNYDRRKKLYDEGAIPNRDLLASQTELEQARASADAARRFLALLETPTGKAAADSPAAAQRESFLTAQLEFTEIRSPFAGVITEQMMYPGDMAKPELPIFTVMDLSVAVARAQVPEAEMSGVAAGKPCTFASADAPQASHAGRVTVVNQAVDPARRTVEVWCEIPNPRENLRSGVFGEVTVRTGSAPRSMVVPKSAVQFVEGSKRGKVLVVGTNKQVKNVDVETGIVTGDQVQVLKGLTAGETIVTEGGYSLPDGTEVRIAEPNAAEEKGEKKSEEKKEEKPEAKKAPEKKP